MMAYFNSRELAAAALFSGLWGILNGLFSPIVFQMFGLPVLCDMIGFAALSLTFWWIRKFGAVTAVGVAATAINFLLNPGGVYFLGFTTAALSFDLLVNLIGRDRLFRSRLVASISLLTVSILSAAVAGLVIGAFSLNVNVQALLAWGGVLGWVGLHAAGGLVGGLIGVSLLEGLSARNIRNNYLTRSANLSA